jgi:nuclear pore complex protein Nup155
MVMCIFCTFRTCILETTCESIPQWYSLSCSYLQDRLSSGEELVGDDDVARALLGACKGLRPVLAVYDQLLSNGAIIPSLNLKLRVLRSVLAILREWGISVIAHMIGTTSAGASFFLDGTFSLNQTGTANQGAQQ